MFKFKLSSYFKSASVRTGEPSKGSDAVNSFNMKHCVPASDPSQLHPVLIEKLVVAQRLAGFQFMFTSAFRSKSYELSKGRNGSSSHCKYDANENPASLAADISTIDSHTRYKVLGACLLAGFPRIGVGKSFIHVDIDETKPHPIVFHYY